MITFQQAETTEERRRWILVLVDSTDGVTGLTGQTGTVKVSKNGGTPANSTNSIVEIDSTNMPGQYYVSLTAAELSDLGWISITKKTAGSLAFHDRAIVSYNDPYTSTGGFSGGGASKSSVLTKKQLDYIVEQVWKYKFTQDLTAQDILNIAAEHPVVDLSSIEAKFGEIIIPETDLSPVLDSIGRINIPQPINYGKEFTAITKQLDNIIKSNKVDVSSVLKVAKELQNKMKEADQAITGSVTAVAGIQENIDSLKYAMDELNTKAVEMSDMDKRFENMTSVMQKQELTSLMNKLDDSVKKLMVTVTELKFDILEELTESNG